MSYVGARKQALAWERMISEAKSGPQIALENEIKKAQGLYGVINKIGKWVLFLMIPRVIFNMELFAIFLLSLVGIVTAYTYKIANSIKQKKHQEYEKKWSELPSVVIIDPHSAYAPIPIFFPVKSGLTAIVEERHLLPTKPLSHLILPHCRPFC